MCDYTLDSRAPCTIESPTSADELAAILHGATSDGAGVVPWGTGTRQHLGYAPERYDIALRMDKLTQVVDYTPADLVLQVEAGATLGEIQAFLEPHGQWLPWDPPCAQEASIGGLLATTATGPLRLAYGTPRDWTLSLRVALGDGRLVKSGAKVVKNVAGYDAHKLHLGAFGTLGVITEATFKLAPLPEHRQTVLVAMEGSHCTPEMLERFRAAALLSPISLVVLSNAAARMLPPVSACVLDHPADRVIVACRFAGVPSAVERQIREMVRYSVEAGTSCIELEAHNDTPLWQAVADFALGALPSESIGQPSSLLLRAGVRPTYVLDVVEQLEQAALQRGWIVASAAYAGIGLVYTHWWPDIETAPATMSTLLSDVRTSVHALGGYVVVEDAPAPLRPQLDIWGPPPETIGLMRSLKAQWDHGNVLNPGRYLL